MPLRFLLYQIRMQTIHHKVINWIWLHEKLGFPYSLKNCLENGKIVLKTSFNFENIFYNLEIWENFSLNNRYENHKIRYIKWNYDKLTCNNFFRYSMCLKIFKFVPFLPDVNLIWIFGAPHVNCSQLHYMLLLKIIKH